MRPEANLQCRGDGSSPGFSRSLAFVRGRSSPLSTVGGGKEETKSDAINPKN